MSPLGSGPLGTTPLGSGGSGALTTGGGTLPPPLGTSFSIVVETGGYGSGFTVNLTPDVTTQTRTIRRGYMSTAPGDGIAAPSTFTFGLDNSAFNSASTRGRYSLDTTAKLAGWGPGSRVLYQVTTNGRTRTRFAGWIQRIDVQPGLFEDQTVTVTAASWLQVASTARATGMAAQVNQRGDQLVATAIGLAQFPPPAVALNTTIDVYPYAFWDLDPTSSTILDAIDSAVGSGLDRCHELADGTLVIESRQFREYGASANVLTLSDVAPSGHPYLAITGLNAYQDLAKVFNHFTVTAHPSRVDAVPVVLYDYPTSGSTTTIGPYQVVQITGAYVDPSQQAQYVAGFQMVDAASGGGGAPGILPASDYQFFDGPNGTGNDISASMTVSVSFEVRQALFTITGCPTTAYLYKLRCRGRGIYNYQPASGSAQESSSISRYGLRSASAIDCPYQTDPVFTVHAATYFAARCAPARTQIDQGVRIMVAAGAEADLDAVLAVDISSPIGASETITGLNAGNYWVNAIQEEWDERNNLTWTGFLDPRDPNHYWEIGVPGFGEIGQTTVAAYY